MCLRDCPNRQSLIIENYGVRKVSEWLACIICASSGSFDSSKLNSESYLGFTLKCFCGRVKGDGPVVHVGIVRLCADAVTLAAKDAPVDIVEVGADIALTNMEINTIGEILGEVVDTPIQPVLVRSVLSCGVSSTAVAKLTTAPVWGPNSPELCTGRLCGPVCGCGRIGTSSYHNVVLRILTEYTVTING